MEILGTSPRHRKSLSYLALSPSFPDAEIAPHGASCAPSIIVAQSLIPRILCVDDEPSVGELIKALLEPSGDFRVEVETKANTAVQRARMFRPDLVFMDIKMPGRDGFTIAREIRQEPWLRHKPIIFFSGVEGVEESVRRAWRSGPTEHLPKGVALTVIEETVRRILAERIKLFHEA